jgi:hypothetical protein
VFAQWWRECNASHAFQQEHWVGDFYAIARTKSKEQLLGHFIQVRRKGISLSWLIVFVSSFISFYSFDSVSSIIPFFSISS